MEFAMNTKVNYEWKRVRKWYKDHGFTAAADDMKDIMFFNKDPMVLLKRLHNYKK
jgi:hypothetical protein